MAETAVGKSPPAEGLDPDVTALIDRLEFLRRALPGDGDTTWMAGIETDGKEDSNR